MDPKTGNCDCGKPLGKPQRVKIVGGKIVYLGERGGEVRQDEKRPEPPAEKEE